MRGIWGSIW